MEIKYTVKIKDEQDPPVFDEKLGKGVLATQVAVFKNFTEDDLKSPMFQRHIYELGEKMKNDWIEVDFEIIKK